MGRASACGNGSCRNWPTGPAWRSRSVIYRPGPEWNKIEHRLFAHISKNWRGQPLVSLAVIVNLIGRTRTAAGLRVRCELDRGAYPKGETITDAQMTTLQLVPHRFHGDWNYTINPRRDACYSVHLFPDDALGPTMLTRIGTNPDDTKCPGYSNAARLRLYFDAVNRASRFGAEAP